MDNSNLLAPLDGLRAHSVSLVSKSLVSKDLVSRAVSKPWSTAMYTPELVGWA
ncbi:hypothetical protein H0I39_04450 [Ottowia beijingensis]|uniref:Uncharacterized protein n=1 Tax=Ottowia beijingensis TaxID=1207057 RepID=A0A853ILF4_9BURK|nr:hypothetical protein [Ottowia beijingensis]NZA01206.1 hypothetical protein [Ottowia beijingensis]